MARLAKSRNEQIALPQQLCFFAMIAVKLPREGAQAVEGDPVGARSRSSPSLFCSAACGFDLSSLGFHNGFTLPRFGGFSFGDSASAGHVTRLSRDPIEIKALRGATE